MVAMNEQVASNGRGAHEPSERDLAIYSAVRVDCRRQVDVALEHGLTQGRVSQIVAEVHRQLTVRDMGRELNRRDEQWADRWLDNQRLEWLYAETLRVYRLSLGGESRRADEGEGSAGEAKAVRPQTVQCLRLAARLLEQRWKLADRTPPPSPHDLARADMPTFIQRLISARHWAEVRGEVPQGEPAGVIVERMLCELLGWQPQSQARPLTVADIVNDIDVPPPQFKRAAGAEPAVASSDADASCAAAAPAAAEANGSAAGREIRGDINPVASSEAVVAVVAKAVVEKFAASVRSVAQRSDQDEEHRRILTELERHYHMRVTPEYADEEVRAMRKDAARRHPLWDYSRQRPALEAWARHRRI